MGNDPQFKAYELVSVKAATADWTLTVVMNKWDLNVYQTELTANKWYPEK